MQTNIEIKECSFDNNGLNKLERKLINWPVVYIINNDKEMYVGETSNIKNRMKQHLENKDRKHLKLINIIFDKQFNKSAILDIEQSLIRMFYADEKYKLQNINNGQSSKHNYYQREMYLNKLPEIWNKLKRKNLVNNTYNNVINSNIYKYSPFVSLTDEQQDIMCDIINNILDCMEGKATNTTSIITGLAGTGKTILAISLIYTIMSAEQNDIDTFKEDDDIENTDTSKYDNTIHRLRKYIKNNGKIKIGFVVPMTQLRQTLKQVFNGINRKLLRNIIIGPGDVIKQKYDLLICDEAHRLTQYKNIANYGEFKKVSRKLNQDEKNTTQLDWILASSKYSVLFYDGNQSVKGSDIPHEKMDELIKESKNYKLTSQIRCKSGNLYLEELDKLFDCTLKNKIQSTDNFEIKLFEDPNLMINKIKELDKEYGLCRNVAGYDWKWISQKGKTLQEIEEKNLYDFDFNGKKYIWNNKKMVNNGWILSDNAVNEIGCIHTVQGYDLNYVGVIIGNDISYDEENNKLIINTANLKDQNVKRGVDEDTIGKYIINTYKTLMERGIKGCYVYSVDKSMENYLKKYIDLYEEKEYIYPTDYNEEHTMVAEEGETYHYRHDEK